MSATWRALVLAAGRGPGDPMAQAYGVSHKCAIPVGGEAMLARVVAGLRASPRIGGIDISIESEAIGRAILGPIPGVRFIESQASAAQSAHHAATSFPLLLTTGDHPLLSAEMVEHVIAGCERAGADVGVGVARDTTILAAYPAAKRTYLRFGADRVSSCNIFALRTERARTALSFWRHVEPVRKKPWRLVSAFGPMAIARFTFGRMDLDAAFAIGSRRLGLRAIPVLLPQAEAAIDVDKPADKELAEAILARRAATSRPPSCAPAADRPESPLHTR